VCLFKIYSPDNTAYAPQDSVRHEEMPQGASIKKHPVWETWRSAARLESGNFHPGPEGAVLGSEGPQWAPNGPLSGLKIAPFGAQNGPFSPSFPRCFPDWADTQTGPAIGPYRRCIADSYTLPAPAVAKPPQAAPWEGVGIGDVSTMRRHRRSDLAAGRV
jgi:hypothetical protein